MDIAIIAEDNKKELMTQFCIAYCGILCHHHLCATHTTGAYISDVTGLEIETLLAGSAGTEQIASRISYNEIDVVFFSEARTLPKRFLKPKQAFCAFVIYTIFR